MPRRNLGPGALCAIRRGGSCREPRGKIARASAGLARFLVRPSRRSRALSPQADLVPQHPRVRRCGAGGFAADHDAAVSGALAHWENAPLKARWRWSCCSIRCRATSSAAPSASGPAIIWRSPPRTGRWRAASTGPCRRPGGCSSTCRSSTAKFWEDQRRGLELMLAIPPVPGRPGDGRMTRLHLEIIERFGRFPHRNAILGRPSTPEELAFLAECEHRFGQPTPEPRSIPPRTAPPSRVRRPATARNDSRRVPDRARLLHAGGGENMRHRVTRQLLLNVWIPPQIPFSASSNGFGERANGSPRDTLRERLCFAVSSISSLLPPAIR